MRREGRDGGRIIEDERIENEDNERGWVSREARRQSGRGWEGGEGIDVK